ncbi:hypothetical protein Peur_066529 [Populus x canadensis]
MLSEPLMNLTSKKSCSLNQNQVSSKHEIELRKFKYVGSMASQNHKISCRKRDKGVKDDEKKGFEFNAPVIFR